MGELLLIILAYQEDVLDLLYLRETSDVVVDYGITSDREEWPWDGD